MSGRAHVEDRRASASPWTAIHTLTGNARALVRDAGRAGSKSDEMGRRFGPVRRRAEAERFVESRGSRVACSQPQVIKGAPSGLDDLGDQSPANPMSPVPGKDVQVPDTADTLVGAVRIDVEAAHPHLVSIDPRDKECLAPLVESVRAARPLVGEPTDEPKTGAPTLGEQLLQRGDWQVVSPLDDGGHTLARATLLQSSSAEPREVSEIDVERHTRSTTL